jgi:hypothetical protein
MVLRYSEAYLVGKLDSPLFFAGRQARHQRVAPLVVSTSTLPQDFLYRLSMKMKPRSLRECKVVEQYAETVVVLMD